MLRAIIFDFDGVIADTERLHLQGFRIALSAHDISISDQQYFERYLGLDDREGFRAILGDHGRNSDSSAVGRLMEEKARVFIELIGERIEIFAGVRELLSELREGVSPMPLAIGSGALSSEIRLILRVAQLEEAFDEIVAADDVTRGKPDPDIFLEACTRLGRSRAKNLVPAECLVVEDSTGGINAGSRAGMRTVAVTNSYPASAFEEADLVVSGLGELSRERCARLFV